MNKLSFIYRKVLLPACLFFTVLCVAFSAILSFSGTEMSLPTINFGNVCQMLAFSVILALSDLLFSCKKLKTGAALILHFLCFIADISVVFFLIGKHAGSASGVFAVLSVFALLYIIVAAAVLVIKRLSGGKRDEPYKRQFR